MSNALRFRDPSSPVLYYSTDHPDALRFRHPSSRVLYCSTKPSDLILAAINNFPTKISSFLRLKFDRKLQCIDVTPEPGSEPTFRVPIKLLKVLLQGEGVLEEFKSDHKESPLHMAVAVRNVEAVTELLELGADPNAKDAESETPLAVIASNRHKAHRPVAFMRVRAIVIKLLEKGASINATDKDFQTPLCGTVYADDTEAAAILLEMGAAPNVKDRWNRTPLYVAALLNRIAIAKVLLKGGADPTISDEKGRAPHSVARKEKKFQQLITDHMISNCLNSIGILKDLHPTVFAYLHGPPKTNPRGGTCQLEK